MERKNYNRTKTSKSSTKYKPNNTLPVIFNMMSKTSTQFNSNKKIKKERKFLHSSDISRKYQIDFKNYINSINTKKEKIFDLERKFKLLNDKNKFNNEIAKELLLKNKKYQYYATAPSETNEIKNNNTQSERVKEYKNNKKNLDAIKSHYIKKKQDNNNIHNDINEINEDLKFLGNNISQKKNDIEVLKNKIKIAEKNNIQRKVILLQYEKEKKHKNNEIIKCLEKQINLNKEKLNEKNNIIEKNNQEINDLNIKLKELEKLIKK